MIDSQSAQQYGIDLAKIALQFEQARGAAGPDMVYSASAHQENNEIDLRSMDNISIIVNFADIASGKSDAPRNVF